MENKKILKTMKVFALLFICMILMENVFGIGAVDAKGKKTNLPTINLAQNWKEIVVGQNLDLLYGVSARDVNGKDITDRVQVTAPDMTLIGQRQTITYAVKDDSGNVGTAEMTLIVHNLEINPFESKEYAMAYLTVRDYPSINANIVATIPYEDPIHVIGGVMHTRGWSKVSVNGVTGYLYDICWTNVESDLDDNVFIGKSESYDRAMRERVDEMTIWMDNLNCMAQKRGGYIVPYGTPEPEGYNTTYYEAPDGNRYFVQYPDGVWLNINPDMALCHWLK